MDRTDQNEEEPKGRGWLAPVALALIATVSLFWLLPDVYDPSLATGDGAVYMVCAKSLLAGDGYSYLGEPFTIRPPGFSLLLAPAIAAFGTDYTILTFGVGLFGVLAVVLLFLYQRTRLGTPVALAAAVAVWLNPGFLRSAGQVMSDVPGLALMFACLLLERWTRRRPSAGRDVLLGLAIGVALYVRSMNALLVPALVCARLLHGLRDKGDGRGGLSWPRYMLLRAGLPAGVALLCLVPWSLRNAGVENRIPAEDTLFHSYSTAMWHQDWGDPGSPRITWEELTERVGTRAGDLLHVLGSRVQERSEDGLHSGLAIGALLFWLVVFARRRGTGEFMTAAMIAVIVAYFGFMNRLVLPVYAMVLPAVAEVVLRVLSAGLSRRAATGVTAAFLLGLAAFDFDSVRVNDKVRSRHDVWASACRGVEELIPPEVLLAANFGAHYSVELDRPVVTLRWAEKRGGVEGAVELIERRGVGALLLDLGVPEEARLHARLRREGHEMLGQEGLLALVRLKSAP